MKSILLTGGTGLVGTDILKHFSNENYKIYAVTRRENNPIIKNVEWIRQDLSYITGAFLDTLPRTDIVIHAGAAVRVQENEDALAVYRNVNMEFSEKLFKWCALGKADTVVIFISSLSFLRKPLDSIITESHPLAPVSSYGISKYWAEEALFNYAGNSSYRPVSFRLSSPIAFDYNLLHETVVKKWIENAKSCKEITVFGKGTRTQDFVSTIDIAHAVENAILNQKANGVYNIGSGTPLSMTKLAKLISERTNCLVNYTGSDANEYDRWNISIEKAKNDFDYRPQYNSIEVINGLMDSIL